MYTEWTKKLGQQHWVADGENHALCGMPLLGNNYADTTVARVPCIACLEAKSTITEDDKQQILLELKDTQAMLESMLKDSRQVSKIVHEPVRLTQLKQLIRKLEAAWIG